MIILALGRRKRVGKDEFANAFRDGFLEGCYAMLDSSTRSFSYSVGELESVVKVAGFADALKVDAYKLFGWAGLREAAYYESNPEARDLPLDGLPGSTPRSIWIALGMFARSIDPDYWINKLFNDSAAAGIKVLIVKDLRFQNEIDAVRKHKSVLIEVENRNVHPTPDEADNQPLAPNWADMWLSNNSTLEQWRDAARSYGLTKFGWQESVLTDLGLL